MNQLRQAAARERRAPIFWWLVLMGTTGGALVWMVYDHSRLAAVFLAVLLAAAWVAPLVALQSLAAPRRAKFLPPAPGGGTFGEWMKQAHLLGRMLLYYGDNPEIPSDVRQSLQHARVDLRDTLKAHPLRDDLERVCGRIRSGAVRKMKEWLWHEYGPQVREIEREYEQMASDGCDEDSRMQALQAAVENSAALMARCGMPRMLERERLLCAVDCAWLAAIAATRHGDRLSPIELAAMLVIIWSDYSEPWLPARAIHQVLDYRQLAPASESSPAVAKAIPAPVPQANASDETGGRTVIRNGKKYRRVRVKRKRHIRRYRGPTIMDIFISFGQWVRYSLRAWTLYR